jgi:hypothetical protein
MANWKVGNGGLSCFIAPGGKTKHKDVDVSALTDAEELALLLPLGASRMNLHPYVVAGSVGSRRCMLLKALSHDGVVNVG